MPPSSGDPTLAQGSLLLGRYRILSHIGRGAWSHVYLARDTGSVGQFCAIKQITTEGLSNEDAEAMMASFKQEGRILAALDHEGLPRIYEHFALGGANYLVMEWIAGHTLLKAMEDRGGPFPVVEVLQWARELCQILVYLHGLDANPVIVGDLKPGNIMLTLDGRLKIVDFGVARFAHAPRQRGPARGYTFVTPGFSPPEQYDTHELDARSDIYALGATMYYLMTGQDMAKFRFQVPPIRRILPSASTALEETLARCLNPHRAGRFADAGTLRRRLQIALDAEGGERAREHSVAHDILSTLYDAKKRETRGLRRSLTDE